MGTYFYVGGGALGPTLGVGGDFVIGYHLSHPDGVGGPGLDVAAEIKAAAGGSFAVGYDLSVLPGGTPEIVVATVGVGAGAKASFTIGGSYTFIINTLCPDGSLRHLSSDCSVTDRLQSSSYPALESKISSLESELENKDSVAMVEAWRKVKHQINHATEYGIITNQETFNYGFDETIQTLLDSHTPIVIRDRENPLYCLHKSSTGKWSNGLYTQRWSCRWNLNNTSLTQDASLPPGNIDAHSNEMWYYDNDTKYIRNFMNPAKCLHKAGDANNWSDGTIIHLYDCIAGEEANKTWSYDYTTGNIHAFENLDKCITHTSQIVLGDCASATKWDLCPMDSVADYCIGGKSAKIYTTSPGNGRIDYIYSDQFGGDGGKLFDDGEYLTATDASFPKEILFRSTNRVYGIATKYDNNVTKAHGTTQSGTPRIVDVSDNPLMQVEVCKAWVATKNTVGIVYTEFTYADGTSRNSEDGAGTSAPTNDCRTFRSARNYPIVGFHGRAGAELDKLGVIYAGFTTVELTLDHYLSGDWNGDDKDTIAIRDGSSIWMDTDGNGTFDQVQTYGRGDSEDQYLIGDWDGDGDDNIAVRRGDQILMDTNGDGTHDIEQVYGRGNSEDQYLVGDWDGDGRDNIAVRRGTQLLMDNNFDGSHDINRTFGPGSGMYQYLAGDWDGDGRDNYALRDDNKILMDTNFDSSGYHDREQSYGQGNSEDEYLVGDWDGDGDDNIAVRRGTRILMDTNSDSTHDLEVTYSADL